MKLCCGIALLAPAIALCLSVAGCDDGNQSAPQTGASAAVAPAGGPQAQGDARDMGGPPAFPVAVPAQPDQTGQTQPAASAAPAANDPSAPTNTPLCGIAAQEANALSRQLLSRQDAEAGECSAFACYDAATATYIGADGYRHVCR